MFTTFQTGKAAGSGDGDDSKGNRGTNRRITTPVACVECRRRKIRCDGLLPCGQCQWYQHPEACSYAKPMQRMMPSRKLVEKLTSSVEQHQMILNRLFGTKDIDTLVSLPREELLNLALSKPAASPSTSLSSTGPVSRTQEESISPLETLEEVPNSNDRIFQERLISSSIQDIQDDVNSLSLRINSATTYVGISSVNAVLKVIFRVYPSAKSLVSTQEPVSLINVDELKAVVEHDRYALPDNDTAEHLITAYFQRVHPFFPMIDEQLFWRYYISGSRKDFSWMALLNMVFALGSVALKTSENTDHIVFFSRASNFLGIRLDVCTIATIEALQALIMVAGYYFHYINRPNEGDSLMGACSRIACQLGLHREFPAAKREKRAQRRSMTSSSDRDMIDALQTDEDPAEVRRRTWWSMYCLDTWACTTTGRPTLGRLTPGVSVREPVHTQSLDPLDPYNLKLLPLIHNIAFCKIATSIQDKLCATPLIAFEEVVQLDANLVRWWEDLPPMLTKEPEENIPLYLRVPRLVMKWRYQNLRILLHRPYLLTTTLKRAPFDGLSPDEKVAVGKCRIIAAKTIEDISMECKNDVVSGWNGVWMAYQAAFVPLISLFTDFSSTEERDKWRSQARTVLSFFSRMERYSVAARTSHEVVSKLLDAAKAAADAANAHRRQEEALMKVIAQREQQQQAQPPTLHASFLPTQNSTVPLSVLTTMAPLQSDVLHHSPHSSPTPSYPQSFPSGLSSLGGNMIASASRGVPQTPPPNFHHSPSLTGIVASPMTLSSQSRLAHGHPMSQPISNVPNLATHQQGPNIHQHYHNPQDVGGSLRMSHSPASGEHVFWDDMMWDTFSNAKGTQQQGIAQQLQQQRHGSQMGTPHSEVYGQGQTGGEAWPDVAGPDTNWTGYGGP